MVIGVDALCTNQGDTTEKNHQVEMIRAIYSRAELGIVWLGSAGDDSDLAMKRIDQGLKKWTQGQGKQYDWDGKVYEGAT